MLRSLKYIAVLGLASATTAVTAHAQVTCSNTGIAGGAASCSVNASVTGTMQRIVFLSLSSASVSLVMPTDVDFSGGGTTTKDNVGAQTATIRANGNWALTIQGAAWTGTGNNTKAISDLAWNKDGGGYTAMTNAAVSFASGAPTSGVTATVGYRTNWALATDTPGTYAMALVFTLTAP